VPSIAEEPGAIFALVQDDVERGLRFVFPRGDGYARAEISEEGGIAGVDVEVVVWTWHGLDTVGFPLGFVGEVQEEPDETEQPMPRLQPTGAEVTVSGITLVERDADHEFTVRRYVDWLAVAHQLGLSFDGRPTIKGPVAEP